MGFIKHLEVQIELFVRGVVDNQIQTTEGEISKKFETVNKNSGLL